MNSALSEKLTRLPPSPGVYLMKDSSGEVIYVGKASSLRNRVRSYFHSSEGLSAKTRALVAEISDLEVIRTKTEAEAFLLEDSLIKKHKPRFNVRLRDDKRYPYLKITKEPFPRVVIVRRRANDGARYFGPHTNAKAMRSTLKLAQRLFPIRTCSLSLPLKSPRRPCLNHQIGRCSAPCAGLISEEEYARLVDGAAMLFEGRINGLVERLRKEMLSAAEERKYERAASLRDMIEALSRTLERQSVVLPDLIDRDVIGLATEEECACAQVFAVRAGRFAGREAFHLRSPEGSTGPEILEAFLTQYYSSASFIPKEVLIPFQMEDPERLEKWLSSIKGVRVRIRAPKRGEKRRLVEMANENAGFSLKEGKKADVVHLGETAALIELAESLSLSSFPQRIEAFDISNTQGKEATGSMVVFENGRPRRDAYRRFKVRLAGKPDDYAMMAEVLRRRFSRGLAEIADPTISRGKFSEFPDLVLIDGGKGQLNVGTAVLKELNIEGLEVIGLAKRHEEVFVPGRSAPIVLPPESQSLLLLRRIRDEAHRFAIDYHRRLRAKRSLSSVLDGVPGIGPKRKKTLIRAFPSLDRLASASAEEVSSATGIPLKLAERVIHHLKG